MTIDLPHTDGPIEAKRKRLDEETIILSRNAAKRLFESIPEIESVAITVAYNLSDQQGLPSSMIYGRDMGPILHAGALVRMKYQSIRLVEHLMFHMNETLVQADQAASKLADQISERSKQLQETSPSNQAPEEVVRDWP